MEERVAKAVSACYEATLAPETWADALHEFSRSIDAACAMFYPHGADKAALEIVPASPEYASFLDFYVEHRWYEGHYRAERGWPMLERGRPVVREHDLATDEERRKLRHYNELYLPFGFHGFAMAGFRVDGRLWAMPVLRGKSQGHFTPEDAGQLNRLRPHLARMVSFAEKLALGQASAGLSMLDQVACPAVLLDWRGAVARTNARAEALLGPDLKLVRGRLVAADRTSDRDLRDLKRKLLARDASLASDVPEPVLIRRFGRRPLLVEAMPVAGLFADVFHRTRALLLISDLEARSVPPESRLRQVFDLTPAEARLAALLATGETVGTAADALGVTKGTARSQLKSVFAKTDTHRQAELVAVLGRLGGRP